MQPRLTAQDFDQDLLILSDAYVHGSLDRRGFLQQAQKYAKAGVTAAGLLAALSPNFAAGQQVQPNAAFGTLDQAKTQQDFLTGATWLKSRPDATGKLGAVGFCWGGGIVHVLSTSMPDLAAGVPFYGNTPAPADAVKVKAPLLVQQAEVDESINAAWPAYEAALKAANVRYTAHRYSGTQHGFNNDTTPRYDAAAAKLAWERTVSFFKTHLG